MWRSDHVNCVQITSLFFLLVMVVIRVIVMERLVVGLFWIRYLNFIGKEALLQCACVCVWRFALMPNFVPHLLHAHQVNFHPTFWSLLKPTVLFRPPWLACWHTPNMHQHLCEFKLTFVTHPWNFCIVCCTHPSLWAPMEPTLTS